MKTVEDCENNFFASIAPTSNFRMGIYLGINDRASNNAWIAADGSTQTYTKWAQNEPNGGNNEDVVHLYGSGEWNDINGGTNRGIRVVCTYRP